MREQCVPQLVENWLNLMVCLPTELFLISLFPLTELLRLYDLIADCP